MDVVRSRMARSAREPEGLGQDGEVPHANVPAPAWKQRSEGTGGSPGVPKRFRECSREHSNVQNGRGPGGQLARVAVHHVPRAPNRDDGNLPPLSLESQHLGDDERLPVP
jgi:hypothetical protein